MHLKSCLARYMFVPTNSEGICRYSKRHQHDDIIVMHHGTFYQPRALEGQNVYGNHSFASSWYIASISRFF